MIVSFAKNGTYQAAQVSQVLLGLAEKSRHANLIKAPRHHGAPNYHCHGTA